MQDDGIDEIITQHAVFKILDNDIIPCTCGGCRKIVQKGDPELLITQCSNVILKTLSTLRI